MEGAIVNALEILEKEHDEFRKISTYLQVSDDEFLLQHWPGQCAVSKRSTTARDLVGAVVERNPLVRCYAFGPGLVNGSVWDPDSDEFRALAETEAKGRRKASLRSGNRSPRKHACTCVGLDKACSPTLWRMNKY